MISYTITVQKTQGQYRVSETARYAETYKIWFDEAQEGPILDLIGKNVYNFTAKNAHTRVSFTQSDGGFSSSSSFTSSSTGISPEPFYASDTIESSNSYTENSNLARTEEFESGQTVFYAEPGVEGHSEAQVYSTKGTTDGGWSLTPTTISAATSTTSMRDLPVRTTETQNIWSTFGTTTQEGSGTATTAVPTTTQQLTETTVGTMSVMPTTVTVSSSTAKPTQFVTYDNNTVENTHPDWDAESTGFHFPPRDTATVFQEFKNDLVWIPTATALEGAGPWPLSAIASSHTAPVTALPLYSTSPLTVIDESNATFPEDTDSPATVTVTTSTFAGSTSFTFWQSNFSSGFPLTSIEIVRPKATTTTTTQEQVFATFSENNPELTQQATEIASHSGMSVEVVDRGLSFQQFPVFSFSTTRYAGTWSQTSSYSYSGPFIKDNGEDGEITFTNLTIDQANGQTIEGTNVERILVRAFSPVAVSHNETSFTEAWGLHGGDPQSVISTPASLSWRTFAELHPGVSVPYPTSTSWKTGATSLSASILGNAITVTTSTRSGSEGGSTSSTYQFEGEEPAHTEQLSGRNFFTNLGQLPALTHFGPHAATGSVETRARPGTYVQISQDSLGDYTLNTLTLQESSAATISKNAILYPAEQSFYTSSGGAPFLVLPRNPTP